MLGDCGEVGASRCSSGAEMKVSRVSRRVDDRLNPPIPGRKSGKTSCRERSETGGGERSGSGGGERPETSGWERPEIGGGERLGSCGGGRFGTNGVIWGCGKGGAGEAVWDRGEDAGDSVSGIPVIDGRRVC